MRIKSYESFSEGLSIYDKYFLKNSLSFIGNTVISWLINAEPLLNEKYQDLKRQTRGLDAYLSHGGNPSTVKNLEKIDLSEIKGTKYHRGLFALFNKWNLYKQYYQSGSFFYLLTKDELEENDMILATSKNWKIATYTTIAICAKFDKNEFLEQALDEIRDIFSDFEMDHNISINRLIKNQTNSKIFLKFDSRERGFINNPPYKIKDKYNSILVKDLKNGIQRSINSLKSIGEEWKYILYHWREENYILKTTGEDKDDRNGQGKLGWVKMENIDDLINQKESEIYVFFYKKGISEHQLKYIKPDFSPNNIKWYYNTYK